MIDALQVLPSALWLAGTLLLVSVHSSLASGHGGHSSFSFSLPSLSLPDFGSLFRKNDHHGETHMVHTKAHVEESPEIGLGIHKIPLVIPLPTIILRRSKKLVSHGFSMDLHGGGHGGGGYGGGYGGGGYDGYY